MPALAAALVDRAHRIVHLLRDMPKPILAVIEGAAAGFGVSLLLACDLALAADDAVFTMAYSHIGASPDGGSTFHLPRTVGTKRAMEMALLGERFDGRKAAEIGLVNRALPAAELDRAAGKLATLLASGPTAAYARTKALLNQSGANDLDAQLAAEADAFARGAATRDFAEGVAAFMEKRRPCFTGR